ncbi:glutathione S-transferase [Fusarium oxysporum f. sp. radicis-lycopersici 26381]|nr:glutathione S-transferase [Fusarium oxysporum f. sp. radicis-lycopersici 26381]
MQPITLYLNQYGPNPWKVALMLEELEIPYTTHFISFADIKNESYTLVNPNGRVPAIEDPNTGIKLWESGAIVEYLIDTYDHDHKLSFMAAPETYLAKQWLFFQVSGQAPYYGQSAWFQRSHPEKVQSVIDRYVNEMYRVNGVLDGVLSTREWLVGTKCSYADLAFLAWQRWAPKYAGEDIHEKFPNVGAWIKRMETRPAVQKVMRDQDQAMAELERNA